MFNIPPPDPPEKIPTRHMVAMSRFRRRYLNDFRRYMLLNTTIAPYFENGTINADEPNRHTSRLALRAIRTTYIGIIPYPVWARGNWLSNDVLDDRFLDDFHREVRRIARLLTKNRNLDIFRRYFPQEPPKPPPSGFMDKMKGFLGSMFGTGIHVSQTIPKKQQTFNSKYYI